MGSRKESLKKSLGISEYPWSSDDEEPANPQNHFDVHMHRGQTTEPRPSVSDMPGPSGQQTPSSPTLSPPRANASRLDRDLYWTLVGNHRPSPVHDVTRRLCHAPPLSAYLSRGPVFHKPPSDPREDRNSRDRPGGSNDIQRILAFKKLTRNLGLRSKSNSHLYAIPARACVQRHRTCTTTRQNSPRSAPSTNGSHSSTSAHSSTGHSSTRSSRGTTATSSAYARPSKYTCNLHAMTSRAPPTRNPIFTPSVPPEAASAARSNRVHSTLKRLQTCRSAVRGDHLRNVTTPATNSVAATHMRVPHVPPPLQQAPPAPEQVAPPLPVVAPALSIVAPLAPVVAPPLPAVAPPLPAVAPLDLAREWGEWGDEPVVVDDPTAAEQSDDVAEVPGNTESMQPTDENDTSEVEAIDVELSNTTAVSLEEEIVEIDAPDDVDASVPGAGAGAGAGASGGGVLSADVGLNESAATPANEETEALQQQSQESKRKREGDDAEPFTVKEFNQSLLRLLECPVCLEWMEPPMSQCRRGHLVCGRCRARLASCPVCRTTFSSVRNRAMEGVAEMVRYPCRHGCGREVRLRKRGTHEASCGARRYQCPALPCAERPPLPRDHLHHHFQSKHMAMLKIGRKHKFSMKVNSEQHDTWLITALHEYFYLRVDVDIRTWGVIVYVAYIGPKCNANHYTYEVSVLGQHNSRKLVYARATHSDLESSSLNVSRQDCFHLTLDQALNFLRFKNRHCEPDKFLDFNVEISKCEREIKDDSDS